MRVSQPVLLHRNQQFQTEEYLNYIRQVFGRDGRSGTGSHGKGCGHCQSTGNLEIFMEGNVLSGYCRWVRNSHPDRSIAPICGSLITNERSQNKSGQPSEGINRQISL